MDLLYLHILQIPKEEVLKGVYIVDGETMYASTSFKPNEANSTYKLYTVINHNIVECINSSTNFGSFDTFVANRHDYIMEQSGRYEQGIKVVTYKTNKLKNKNIKKPKNERTEIVRFTSNRRRKLF